MRILLVTHYFAPEIGAPSVRLSEFASVWAKAGDDVTVLTGMPNHPTGVIQPSYRGRSRIVEHVDGFRIVRTWLYASPNKGFLKRTLGHLSFMVTSVLLGGRLSGPADVVVVSSPSFFSIFSGWVLARVRRARFVIEVRDLWPAILVELGLMKNGILIRSLEYAELAAYRAADAVVVVSDGFRQNLIDRGISADKLHVVRNGVDLDRFGSRPSDPVVRARLGATSEAVTIVLYIGTHGLQHGLSTVLDGAALLGDDAIHFALVGEGAEKDALANQRESMGLKNLTMLSGVPIEEVPALLAAADICLVPRRDVPLFSTFIPAKLFEYLGAGRPVIGTVRGEAADILADAGGIVVEPENPAHLAQAIRELALDQAGRLDIGVKARRYAERHCDRQGLADRYRDLLHQIVDRT
jgi:glycosyltransferase involved in cell wall biosynthesis